MLTTPRTRDISAACASIHTRGHGILRADAGSLCSRVHTETDERRAVVRRNVALATVTSPVAHTRRTRCAVRQMLQITWLAAADIPTIVEC